MKCNQCDSLYINGVFCHETGCENQNKTFRDGEWVNILQCDICGCDVLEGDYCDCEEYFTEDELELN